MEFPSTADYYYSKPTRQIIIESDDTVMALLSAWCQHKYFERPNKIKTETDIKPDDNETESMFTNVKGGSLNLFNYSNWVYTSESYKSEQEMKADWIIKATSNNTNVMRAISHPPYNTII